MKRLLTFLPVLLFLLLLVALMAALHHGGGDASKFDSHVGDPVPTTDLLLIGQTDTHFATADWIGRPYAVNFFASWCAPCHAEHEQVMRLAMEHIPVIGIAFKDKPGAVKAFLEQAGNPFLAIAPDEKGVTGIDWGITGVPETFLIDARGIIQFHFAGPLTEDILRDRLLPVWREMQK